jgi:hypothetical protein
MPRSQVTMLSWVVAGAFILATGLLYLDRLDLVAKPPDLGAANMVDRVLGSLAYRQAIWPVFLWTYLLFAIGFLATVAFAANVASASGAPGGLPTFRSLATSGGIIAAIASIIPLGAVNAAVWLGYCDCGFKQDEIVSQVWAQMVAQDIGDWFNRVASVTLGLALIALVRNPGEIIITPALRTWTYLTAVLLIAVPILIFVDRFEPLPELLTAAIGVLLVPVWAVWLGRSIDSTTMAPAPLA